jgi:hypothetical protein
MAHRRCEVVAERIRLGEVAGDVLDPLSRC